MDVSDFCQHMRQTQGWGNEQAMAEWKRLHGTNIDREGEGATLQLWVPLKKRRMHETERFIEGTYEEGSKQIKAPTKEDAQHLNKFAVGSCSSHEHTFLRRHLAPSVWFRPVAVGALNASQVQAAPVS